MHPPLSHPNAPIANARLSPKNPKETFQENPRISTPIAPLSRFPFRLSPLLDALRPRAVLNVPGLGLLRHAHLSGKGGVRGPLGRGAGAALGKHLVDLLEGEALGLGDEEVRVDEADRAEAAPDVKDLGAEVALVLVHHVGGDDGDDAVPCA